MDLFVYSFNAPTTTTTIERKFQLNSTVEWSLRVIIIIHISTWNGLPSSSSSSVQMWSYDFLIRVRWWLRLKQYTTAPVFISSVGGEQSHNLEYIHMWAVEYLGTQTMEIDLRGNLRAMSDEKSTVMISKPGLNRPETWVSPSLEEHVVSCLWSE